MGAGDEPVIVGIGVDLVDIPRFERTLERTPKLRERLFTPAERDLPLRSLAARYAAKEALIKALGGSDGISWSEIEVARMDERLPPRFELSGATAERVAGRGITRLHLSLSHDAGIAIAYVTAEGAGDGRGLDVVIGDSQPDESDPDPASPEPGAGGASGAAGAVL